MSENHGRSSNSRDNRGGGNKPGRTGASGSGRSSSGNRGKPAGGGSRGASSKGGGSGASGSRRASGGSSGGYKGGSGGSGKRTTGGSSGGGYKGAKSSGGQRSGGGYKGAKSSGRSDSRRDDSRGRSGGRDAGRRDDRGRDSSRGRDDRPAAKYKSGLAAQLPHWLVEDLQRTTPPARVGPALESFGEAVRAFEEGKYRPALRHAKAAKDAAPRSAPVREVVGLSAYRAGDWQTALTELRAYRRMSGDTMHLPIEMDVMRALGKGADIEKAYKELEHRGGHPSAVKEGRVVYASYLIDENRVQEAWDLVRPARIEAGGHDADRRLWYVAARAAALLGDKRTAGQLRDAILLDDPGFPGIDELETLIRRGARGS